MLRRLFAFFSVLSLLTCVTVCVLWVMQPAPDVSLPLFEFRWKGKRLAIECVHLQMVVTDRPQWRSDTAKHERLLQQNEDARREVDKEWRVTLHDSRNASKREQFRDIRRREDLLGMEQDQLLASYPRMSVLSATTFPRAALVTFLLPGGLLLCDVFRRTSARRRRRSGLCPACGYDLRATPERCPECGADGQSGRDG